MNDEVGWIESSYRPASCVRLGHRLVYRFLRAFPEIEYRHGDNPEAVLTVRRTSFKTDMEAATEVREMVAAWTDRIHKYEDGEPLDATAER